MSDDQQALPVGWELATLGDVAAHSTDKVEPEDCPEAMYIGLEHIESETNRILGRDNATCVRSTKGVFRSGDVLYGKLRPYLKKVCRPDFDGVCSTDILVYPSRNDLDNGYLLHFLSQATTAEYANENSNGINLPRVSATSLAEISFPLPPLAEQRRIVSKIEALQERSGRAAKALAEVGPLLEQFRQSILAAAFSGRLTADWREKRRQFVEDEHRRMDIPVRRLSSSDPSNEEEVSDKNVQATKRNTNNDETATELLARIRTERRRRWEEAELAKYEAKGRRAPDGWKDSYEEPVPVDESELPEVTESWLWSDLQFVMDERSPFCYGVVQPGSEDPEGQFLIRAGDISTGEVNISDLRKIPMHIHNDFPRSQLRGGEILVTVVGANIGVSAMVPESCRGFNIARALAKISIADLNAHFIRHWLTHEYAIRWMKMQAREVARPTLNLEQLKCLPIPIPSFAEQVEVVRRVSTLFDALTRINAATSDIACSLTSLNQSILAKAFRGELVPQDPGDEPASELLARIREQRGDRRMGIPARHPRKGRKTASDKNVQATEGERRMDIPVRRPRKARKTISDKNVQDTEQAPQSPVVISILAEGGGATVHGTTENGVTTFWTKGSYMMLDENDNDFWKATQSARVSSLQELLEPSLALLYPEDVNAAFLQQLQEWYHWAIPQVEVRVDSDLYRQAKRRWTEALDLRDTLDQPTKKPSPRSKPLRENDSTLKSERSTSMKTIPVFYCPEMSVDSGGYSPSASKPQQVVADWQNAGIATDIQPFVPATADELSEVHDRDHVLDVLEGRENNGHDNRKLEVSRSCLWTVGSFVAAAQEAVNNGRVACSPTSGFHHAGYDHCGGFCTFNGLMVAAHQMIAIDLAVAIVDCDRHFGDGTQDIIERLNLEHRVAHWTYGRDVPSGFEWPDFEQQIRRFINEFAEHSELGGRVLLYQAGADVHVDDPLGPGRTKGMTDDDMRQRDRLIFTICRDLQIPIVWNLAGGYQRDQRGGISRVLDLHRATMEECVRCFSSVKDRVC